MIKTFEQFINENYNEIKTVAIDEECGGMRKESGSISRLN